jgi:hypothetical protein
MSCGLGQVGTSFLKGAFEMAVSIERIASEVEDQESDLSPYKIVSYPADYTLQGLHDKWKKEEIEIPPFQRQFVWTQSQASRLIESFLLGLPVPGIFFYKDKQTQKLLVIDGQQRLKTVFGFFDGYLDGARERFVLRGVRHEWEGRAYTDLIEPDQIRLRDSVLRATIVDQLDPADTSSVFHIFERLNTGGTVLKPQEVRNCIFQGAFNDLLIELNGEGTWRKIVGSGQQDKRMRDIELILRFLSLHEDSDKYTKPMKDFLSDFMRSNRYAKPQKLEKFRQIFASTTQKVVDSLGRKPFHIKAGLNAAVFDSVMVAFATSEHTLPDMRKRFRRLLNLADYQVCTSTGTTDVDAVKKRIGLARSTLFRQSA